LLPPLADAARAAALDIEQTAARNGDACTDYATTLIIGVARKLTTGWLCASFSVGDGLAALWDSNTGTVAVMIASDSGEYAGQTRFLRSDLLADANTCATRLFLARPQTFTAFCLMSDGVSDARFASAQDERDPAHWAALWSDEIAPLLHGHPDAVASRLCDWLNFRVPGEHDDRSIVLMLPARGDRP